MKEAVFLQEVKEIQLLKNALTLLDWDSSTGMPEKSSPFRGEVEGYLTGLYFERSIGPVIQEVLAQLFKKHWPILRHALKNYLN